MPENEQLVKEARQVLNGAHYYPGSAFQPRPRNETWRAVKAGLTRNHVPATYWIKTPASAGETKLQRYMANSLVRSRTFYEEDLNLRLSGYGLAKVRDGYVRPILGKGEKVYQVVASYALLHDSIIFDRDNILSAVTAVRTPIGQPEVELPMIDDPKEKLVGYLALVASVQSETTQYETPAFDIIAV